VEMNLASVDQVRNSNIVVELCRTSKIE